METGGQRLSFVSSDRSVQARLDFERRTFGKIKGSAAARGEGFAASFE